MSPKTNPQKMMGDLTKQMNHMGQSASVLVSSKNDKEKPTPHIVDRRPSIKKTIVKETLSGFKSRNIIPTRDK
jgi:hypothetical protein